jgi:poly(3-hydroxybutyrate) depolymerase
VRIRICCTRPASPTAAAWCGSCSNSSLSSDFRGFAAVGKALDPEKARHYRCELASAGALPEPAPVAYIQGTADRGYRPPFTLEETALGMTLPAFTVTEMLERNGIPTDAPATARLVPGSAGVTEVVVQLFEGTEAFLTATVINGGHNWPTPTTRGNPPVADHFDATAAIVEFWRRHAGLPRPHAGRSRAGQRHGTRTILPRVWRCSSSRYASCTSARE